MDKKIFLIFIITLSFIIRVIYFFAQPDLCTDHLSQMAMAQNFIDGNGFSFKYFGSNLESYYITHIQWPPLYPLVLAGLTFITGNSLFSSLLIQIIVLLLLVFIWKKIFDLISNLVSEEAYYYFISFLIISTSILNNINTVLVFALLILSFSLYYVFAYLFSESGRNINLITSSIFASILFWTHYSYFFVAFFPAVTMITVYFLQRQKKHLLAGIGSFLISLTITSGVLIYNYINTGLINYMDNPEIWDAGFFPQHLLLTDPFFLNSFFKTSYFFDYLLSSGFQIVGQTVFQLFSLLIFIFIVSTVLRLKRKNNTIFENIVKTILPFAIIIIMTLSFLLYFTLRYHEIPRPGWTHIGDPRYLSAVYLSIIAVVVILLFNKAEILSEKIIKVLKTGLLVLVFANIFINAYITFQHFGKYTFNKNNPGNFEGELQSLYDNIKSEINNSNNPVFIDNELTVRSVRITQYAGAAVVDFKQVINIEKFSKGMVFFFIMREGSSLRTEDQDLLNWSRRFNTDKIGTVYDGLTLFKTTGLKNEK